MSKMNEGTVMYDVKQRTPEWFALRAGYPTGSEGKSLLAGKAGFETYAFKKFSELNLITQPENYSSASMERGTDLEPEAIEVYTMRTLESVMGVGFLLNKSKHLGCSPDGLVGAKVFTHGIEIKCFNETKHQAAILTREIDADTYKQVQICLEVTGLKLWKVLYYNPNFAEGLDLVVIDVQVDKAMSTKIKERAQAIKETSKLFKQVQDENIKKYLL